MQISRYSTQFIDDDDILAVTAALKQNALTGGENVAQFEKDIALYTGAKYAVVFANATAALHASYAVCGVGADDEIVVPAISFAATANAALYLNATPVFCDIEYASGLIDTEKIEDLITPKTKLIVPMHYAGSVANMQRIRSIAQKHNLKIVEDAAHALGSFADGKSAGSFGDIGVFSFHPVKPITTGEGGAAITDSLELADKLRLFRSHGIEKKSLWNQDMLMLGYNYRLSDINCALGVSQLKKLDLMVQRREKIAQIYIEAFKNSPVFTLKEVDGIRSSRHLFATVLDRSLWCKKEAIFVAMQQADIGVQVHYKPIYKHSYYKARFANQPALSNSEDFYKATLSLPCHQQMSEEEARFVASTLLKIIANCASDSCER